MWFSCSTLSTVSSACSPEKYARMIFPSSSMKVIPSSLASTIPIQIFLIDIAWKFSEISLLSAYSVGTNMTICSFWSAAYRFSIRRFWNPAGSASRLWTRSRIYSSNSIWADAPWVRCMRLASFFSWFFWSRYSTWSFISWVSRSSSIGFSKKSTTCILRHSRA